MNYWLMKSEPNDYSISDLKRDRVEPWTGVRNYQVRNMMRDEMRVGDMALFYHSNAGKDTGIAGIMKINKKAFVDPTQFDKNSQYYDTKSKPENPRWVCVEVKFFKQFKSIVTLKKIKNNPELQELVILKKGNRLSVCQLTKHQFNVIVTMASLS